MYGKLELFPILFFHYKINNWEQKKKYLLDLKSNQILNKDPIDNLLTDFSKSKIPYNEKIQFLIKEELDLFKKDIQSPSDFKVTSAWFQEYKKAMNQGVHTHGAYGYSAVIYVNFDKKIHPSTSFFCEHLNFIDGAVESFEPNVDEGSLVLFPSNLKHYAQANASDTEKVIMSFNIEWNPQE